MLLEALVGVAITALFGTLIWVFGRRADRRRVGRFDRRRVSSVEEVWSIHYRNSGISRETVEEALLAVQEATGIPAGRLRVNDRFSEELAPEPGWTFDDGLAELSWRLGASEGVDFASIKTVDDYIRAFSQKRVTAMPEPH